MTTGGCIKKARLSAGLTQAALGNRCGINKSAISKYETGRHIPKYETLCKIADALGVPACDLLPGQVVLFDSLESMASDIKKQLIAEARTPQARERANSIDVSDIQRKLAHSR